MAWYDPGGPTQVLAELWADVEYGLAMAVERGGMPLADLAGCRLVARWRRVGDVHWVAIRELPDGSVAVEASWLRFCGADVYTGDTAAEAREAAEGRARALRDSLPGRWEEATADGRTPVSAGEAPDGVGADRVRRNPPALVPQRTPVDDAGQLPQRPLPVR